MRDDDLKNITLQQLEALTMLMAEGSFSRAAKRMGLSQPSLTKHIQNVEDLLDVPVVIRGRSGVQLTPEGRILSEYARKTLKSRVEAGEQFRRLHDNEGGDIAIAASTIPANYILPRILYRFRQAHPRIRLSIRNADSREVIEMIEGCDREIGFVGKKPAPGKLEAEPIWPDRLALIVRTDHPWVKDGAIPLSAVMTEPFILRQKGSGTRALLEQFLKDHGYADLSRLSVIAEMGSPEGIKEAVLAGLGVSVLSLFAVRRELDLGLLKEAALLEGRIERSFYLIHRRNTNFMRHHHLFLDFVRNCGTDIAGIRPLP